MEKVYQMAPTEKLLPQFDRTTCQEMSNLYWQENCASRFFKYLAPSLLGPDQARYNFINDKIFSC